MPIQDRKQNMDEAAKRRRRELAWFYRVLGICMALLLVAVFVLNLVLPDKTFSESEKRMLAQAPEVSAERVLSGAFGDDFEEYASDQMLLRKAFVSLKTVVDGVFGKKESQGVLRGKSGWLIQKMETPKEATLTTTMMAMNQFQQSFEANYTFVLVPNAVTIYSEKLPLCAPSADQKQFSSMVQEMLSEGNITYLDLTDALLIKKDTLGELLYYRTDHHWTTTAAFECREEILTTMNRSLKGVWHPLLVTDSFVGSLVSKSGFSASKKDSIYIYTPEKPQNYLVSGPAREGKSTSIYSMEGLQSSDPYTVFLGGNDGLLHIETDAVGGGKLLVFKDSYFNCFLPFLLNEYETIDVVDPRYFSEDLGEMMLANDYDDVLFFYNMNTFSEDTSLALVLSEAMGGKVGPR